MMSLRETWLPKRPVAVGLVEVQHLEAVAAELLGGVLLAGGVEAAVEHVAQGIADGVLVVHGVYSLASREIAGDVQHLLDGGQALADLAEAVVGQVDHAAGLGDAAEVVDAGVGDDGVAELVVDHQQLVDAEAALVAGVAATAAAGALGEGVGLVAHAFQGLADVAGRLVGPAALGADPADQPLGQHQVQGGADQVGLDAHVDQPGDGRAGVVGVQGAEDQVAGQRRLDGGAGGLLVADLADHDHVGVLPQERPQGLGEGQADLLLHLELVDQRQVILDRVLDGADVVLHRADGVQRGVERGRLAAAGGAGHQDDAVGRVDVAAQQAQHVLGEAQVFQVQRGALGVQHADHGLLAAGAGEGAHAEIDLAALHHHVHAPVLGQPPLADVHAAHDLDAAGDGG